MAKSMTEFGKDKTSYSNLPQEAHMEMYPKGSGVTSDLNDNMTGIDEIVSSSISKVQKHKTKR